MKIKTDFVTNSSSTCFVIVNKTNEDKTLVDFVKENPQIIDEYCQEYTYSHSSNSDEKEEYYTQENLIASANKHNIMFKANSGDFYNFGDEDGTLVGQVFDYMLREGGESKSFKWWMDHYER